jgi:hypothetical protein
MPTFSLFLSLFAEGVCWAAFILCALRIMRRLEKEAFSAAMSALTPVWAFSALAVVVFYGTEVFIAVYSASEYEGYSFVHDGQDLSGGSMAGHIFLTVAIYTLPSILLLKSARRSFGLTFGVAAFMLTTTVVLPRMSERPNKAPEPTPRSVTIRAEPRIAPARVVAHL